MFFPFLAMFDRPLVTSAAQPLKSILPSTVHDQFEDLAGPPASGVLTEFLRSVVPRPRRDPSPPVGLDRYAAMSALQKAVRLGDHRRAGQACESLVLSSGPGAVWRRIRVIAVEDVGAGDPAVAAFVLWLARQKALQQELGQSALMAVALDLMCRAVKSRDMCDLNYWASLPGSVDGLTVEFGREDSSRLISIASDNAHTLRVRHAATRALFPARPPGVTEWRRRNPVVRAFLYDALQMPGPFISMIEADVAFGEDALTAAGPMIWALMAGSSPVGSEADPLDPGDFEQVGDTLGSTFDRHTRLGSRVLADMLKQHRPWMDFFARHPSVHPMDCLRRALFYVEGGILRPRLRYDHSLDLYWSILEAKFASTGIPSMAEGGWELLELVQAALPEINVMRRRASASARSGTPTPARQPGHTKPPASPTLPFMDHSSPDYGPITDPGLIAFGERQGGGAAGGFGVEVLVDDGTSLATPHPIPIPAAVAMVQKLRPGEVAGTLIPPMPVVPPPCDEANLDFQQYRMTHWPLDRMVSVIPCFHRHRLIDLIEGRDRLGLPLVVISEGVAHIYRGLEGIVARQLLGETEVIVKIVRRA